MMKKLSIFWMLTLLAVSTLWAIPAKRRAVTVTQPDGSKVTIVTHGDEWHHYTTTIDGYTVEQDARGYFVFVEQDGDQLKATSVVAHDELQRTEAERQFLSSTKKHLVQKMSARMKAVKQAVEQGEAQRLATRRAYNYNNFKGLIILVEYNDKKFSRSDYKDIITDMVNKPNYTGYDNQQYTGSVRDYFNDNSNGEFKPQFDVVGPYTIDYSQYDSRMGEQGYDNMKVNEMVLAAVNAADADVDFSQYASPRLIGNTSYQFVDLVYLIFAGIGSNLAGNDKGLWWPHRSSVYDVGKDGQLKYLKKDGVYVNDYASSTELTGWTSNPETVMIDGIGTICHEFSHVLGLPDFYDTDYEGSGGVSNTPNLWSIMAAGSYENNSRTPVGYSLYERYAVGFTDEPPVLTTAGNYTLNPLHSSLSGYRLNTPVDDEFFLLENRQKEAFKWDAYLPGSGMLVHRVDKTNTTVWSMYSGDGNKVNVNPERNYYEVIRAQGEHKNETEYVDSDADVFPGTGNVTALTNTSSPANLKTWNGTSNKFELYDIKMQNGQVTFRLSEASETGIVAASVDNEKGMVQSIYDLQGRKVANPTKGLYIVNGRKVAVK